MKANRKAGTGAGPRAGPNHGEEEGAIHVLEAVIFAILILASIAFVVTFEVPSTQNQQAQADLEVLLSDALEVLASRPSPEAPEVYRDALEQYVMESISGNPENLRSYLDAVLPPGVEYNLYLDNGYARFPVTVSGAPPREAVAESRLFVPKLSYTFLEPDVRYQHSEVPMSVWALPVAKGVLLQDEGESVEFWVTGTEFDADTMEDVPFTSRAFHTTAWVADGGAVPFPSVSILLNETPDPPGPYEPAFRYVPKEDLQGDTTYLFPVELRETSGNPVPQGTKLTFHLPRGWNITVEQQAAMVEDNDAWWTEIEIEGNMFVGWNVTAELLNSFSGTSVFFRHGADYDFLIDTSANFHLQHEYYLGSGAQGRGEVVVESPALNPAGKLGRRVWPSLSRPSVGGEEAMWGLTFTNAATEVKVTEVGFRIVSGADMVTDVQRLHNDMTRNNYLVPPGRTDTGTEWVRESGHRYVWNPLVDVTVPTGEALDFVIPLSIAPTTNTNYRGLDYVKVPLEFHAMWNVTAHNPDPVWDGKVFHWSDNLTRHGGEFTFKDVVFPYDDWPALGYPTDQGVTFYFQASTEWQGNVLPGNRTYTVEPEQFLSSTFSEYQGAAQQSRIEMTDATGAETREFELGSRAYIRNDFSALFSKLGRLDQVNDDLIADNVNVVTEVFSPAGAHGHVPAQVYRETGAVSSSLEGPVARLAAVDLDGDTVLDALVGGADKNVYALDGNDGSKFWTYTTGGGHQAGFAFADLDGDTVSEVITGSRDNLVSALRKDPAVHADERLFWAVEPTSPIPGAGHDVNRVAAFNVDADVAPEILVATGEDTKPGHVYVLDGATGATQWDFPVLYDPVAGVDVSFLNVVAGTVEGQAVVFGGSRNDRVYAFDARSGERLYDHAMPPAGGGPNHGDVETLEVGDLDGDGTDDVVVAQPNGHVWAFNGEKATTDTHIILWGGVPAIEDIEVVDEWRQLWVGAPLRFRITTDGWATSKYVYPDNTNPAPYVAADFLDRNAGYLASTGGKIYRTMNGGLANADWTPFTDLSTLDTWVASVNGSVTDMKWVSANEAWVVAKTGRAYHYWDKPGVGLVWEKVKVPCETADPCPYAMELHDLDVLPGGEVAVAGFYEKPVVGTSGLVARWSTAGADEWIVERTFPGRPMLGLDMLNGNEGWVVGAFGSLYHTADGWTTVEAQRLNDRAAVTEFLDVEMASPESGYVAGSGGAMYRLINGGDEWTRLASELPAGTTMRTVAGMGDTYAWYGGDLGSMVALHSYERSAALETVTVPHKNQTFATDPLTVTLNATETVLLDNSNLPNTLVDWYVSTDGGATWTQLELDPSPLNQYESMVQRDYFFTGEVPCDDCTGIRLRAVLSTPNSEASGVENDDMSPILKSLNAVELVNEDDVAFARMTGWDLVGGESTILHYDDELLDGDVVDEERTDARRDPTVGTAGGAVVLDRMEKLWSFQANVTNDPLGRDDPFVDATHDWNGDALPDVTIAGTVSGELELYVLNGANGTLLHHYLGPPGPGPGVPTSMLVTDLDGEPGWEIVVGTDDPAGKWYVEVFAVAGGALAPVSSYLVATSILQPEPVKALAYGGDHDLDTWSEVLVGSDGGEVVLVDAKPLTDDLWRSNPSDLQGKVTFSFPIDMQSLYGTYMVVSSLEFEIKENNASHTQVAKQVSYFHVKPPGGEVPRPPFYDLEIVAWIPEV